MRKFFSYGAIESEVHYYVPRQELINQAKQQLLGDNPDKGGYYITIWAPRQTGKSWIMQEVSYQLQQDTRFDVALLDLQFLEEITDLNQVAQFIAWQLNKKLNLGKLTISSLEDFHRLFEWGTLTKPLILILDEFDALPEIAMSNLVSIFRHIYNARWDDTDKSTTEKDYLLHGMALIGVRTVLGIENVKGSPFNVQRSLHIPNLTHLEVIDLFNQYQQESGQSIEPEVVERIWYEFQGQPGLTCWFGELLTETHNKTTEQPITMAHFQMAYVDALDLHNSNILNLISKAKQEPYKPFILELFQTKNKIIFIYDDPITNFLYLNGIVSIEQVGFGKKYVKFACPYIQKRLFNYFARELYHGKMVELSDPLDDLSDTITDETLNVPQLLRRYEQHLQANRDLVLKNAPRRQEDLRVYEVVFHFHFYFYLTSFLDSYEEAQVQPEFPTGNGEIDLLIRHAGQLFGLELKSFAGIQRYQKALSKAAEYGKQLGLSEIWLVLFIETIDDKNQQRLEADYLETGVTVHPVFVQTGEVDC